RVSRTDLTITPRGCSASMNIIILTGMEERRQPRPLAASHGTPALIVRRRSNWGARISQRSGQPKSDVVVPAVGIPPLAVGGAKALWAVTPGTAAEHPATACAACSRVAIAGIPIVAIVPAVLGPIPHVAVYLVEAPRVRIEAVDGHGPLPILPFGAAALC